MRFDAASLHDIIAVTQVAFHHCSIPLNLDREASGAQMQRQELRLCVLFARIGDVAAVENLSSSLKCERIQAVERGCLTVPRSSSLPMCAVKFSAQ